MQNTNDRVSGKEMRVKRNVWRFFALLAGNLLFFLTIWMANKYDKVTIDQFVYQMKSSAAGANRSLMNSAIIRVGLFGIVATLVETAAYLLCSGRGLQLWKENRVIRKLRSTGFSRIITRQATAITAVILAFSMTFFTLELNFAQYVCAMTTESDFIEEHYVNPNDVELTFPEEKRNLIYIFLESMEVTFSDPEVGGPITDNFIPELTQLAQENINFSNDEGVGGALSFSGTTWTAAALVTQTSGMVVQVPLNAEEYGGENEFIPGLVSIGEVLEQEGYRQVLLVGSDGEFAGRDSYFEEHGNYENIDTKSLKAEGRLPEDYDVWWGFEDAKLFAYAKEELLELAASGEPFNFTMLTCDTHFPDGYRCEKCGDTYDARYPNVMKCSSEQVYEFVQWIQQQDFYENTTIVICGDHLTMDPDFMEGADEDYVRTIYNCIINSPAEPVAEKNRTFGTFDMFPTTLAAMGVEIEGNRLGLGTNLFSDMPTLAEEYGYENLNWELQCKSEFYNSQFLQIGTDE